MKRLLLGILAVVALATIATLAALSQANAQSATSGGQALEISPPVITLSANPGQTIKTQLKLRDISTTPLIVTGQVNDFVAAGEDGTPKIILDEETTSPFSLKSWVRPLAELRLEPREIRDLPVTIVVPKDAAPGGYYAVIRFTARAPELNGPGVSLSASLGSLVLIRVNGAIKESMSIESFTTSRNNQDSWLFESAPIDFTARLKNTGNIHEQPSGRVTITDMFGKDIAGVDINQPPRFVLPDSTRKFTSPLNEGQLGNRILFGKYTAVLKTTYGNGSDVQSSTLTFWVIPYRLIGAALIVLIGGFLALRAVMRRYNQHIIRRATNQHQKRSSKTKKR